MIDMSDIDQVKALQSDLRVTIGSDQGKFVMKWLEELCGWYDFHDIEPNLLLIKHGKRSVLATIKTLLECSPEQIVALTKEQ